MEFDMVKKRSKVGEFSGFVFGFFLFTTILFLILKLLDKLPDTWSYLHIIGITVLITFTGTAIRRTLR